MAEQFTKPKAFTKEWFSYVWDYYRYHILVSLVVLILAIFVAVQFFTTIKYDANINFLATVVLDQETSDKITEKCAQNSNDLNGNGRVDISIAQLNFTKENRENIEMHSALLNKLMTLFADKDELIFVVDDYMLEEIQKVQYFEDIFFPANDWKKEEAENYGKYAVSLKDSEVLKEAGVNCADMYVLVAKMDYEDGLNEQEKNAMQVANYLAK